MKVNSSLHALYHMEKEKRLRVFQTLILLNSNVKITLSNQLKGFCFALLVYF